MKVSQISMLCSIGEIITICFFPSLFGEKKTRCFLRVKTHGSVNQSLARFTRFQWPHPDTLKQIQKVSEIERTPW